MKSLNESSVCVCRYEAQCGSATLSDGTRVVVVSGGYENRPVDTVSIFNTATKEWSIGMWGTEHWSSFFNSVTECKLSRPKSHDGKLS